MADLAIRTILVPTDFSEPTHQVMEYALFLARTFGAKIHLFHVYQSMTLSEAVNWLDTLTPPITEAAFSDQLKQSAEKQIARLQETYAGRGVELVTQVTDGVPFVEIIRLADRERMDLIIMGSHGRTGMRHLLIGSVAEKVVRKAPCPVLVIKPTDFHFELPRHHE